MEKEFKIPASIGGLKQAASVGNLDEVCRIMREMPDIMRDPYFLTMELKNCLDVLTKRDPTLLVKSVFTQVISFQAYLLLRAQQHVHSELKSLDDRNVVGMELPEDIARQWLPRIDTIQQNLQSSCKTFATACHTMALAETANPRPVKHSPNVVRMDDYRSSTGSA